MDNIGLTSAELTGIILNEIPELGADQLVNTKIGVICTRYNILKELPVLAEEAIYASCLGAENQERFDQLLNELTSAKLKDEGDNLPLGDIHQYGYTKAVSLPINDSKVSLKLISSLSDFIRHYNAIRDKKERDDIKKSLRKYLTQRKTILPHKTVYGFFQHY